MLTLTASGSVSDYDENAKSSLQNSISDAAGVDASATSITVAAASVIITATIEVDDTHNGAALVSSLLKENFGTAAAASALLNITVESDPSIEKKRIALQDGTPPPSPSLTTDMDSNATDKEATGLSGDILFLLCWSPLFCCLPPLFCYIFARFKYGAGKARIFFRVMFSHSNANLPFLYIPLEEREKIRLELSRPQRTSRLELSRPRKKDLAPAKDKVSTSTSEA